MPITPPPSDDTPQGRLRGDTHLRAERRHLAEVAAARLLETTIPVTSMLSGARPSEEPFPVEAEPVVVSYTPFEQETIVEPAATPLAPARFPAVTAFRNPDVNPLASFRSEMQSDLRLVEPSTLVKPSTFVKPPTLVKPLAPVRPLHPPGRMPWNTTALLPAAGLVTIALGAVIAAALTIWPKENGAVPGVSEATVATSERTDAPLGATPTAPAPLSLAPASSGGGSAATANPAPAAPPPSVVRPIRDTPAVTAASTSFASVGQLRITSSPTGARVTINGIGWGQTPVTVKNLPLGTKTVRLTSDGYSSAQRTVELSSGEAVAAVHLALKPPVNR
jgi:hypothetical protein